LIRLTDLSINWPEVARFRERVASRYRPGVKADCVVILPCSKRKPYSLSRSHRLFAQAIGPARKRASVEELTITSPLGAVPRALEAIPPASNYDIAVTGVWSDEEVEVVSRSLTLALPKYSPTEVVAHVSGGYLKACQRSEAALGWTFRYTGTDKPASKEGLDSLSNALQLIDGHPRRMNPIEPARHVLSYQYGPEIGERMTLPPARREMSRRMERVVRDGKPVAPERDAKRLFAAKVALTCFDRTDGVLHLAEMLADPTLAKNQRYDIVLRLGRRPDPRAIPYLVKVIKTDSNYYNIDLAIGALAELKYRAAVEGLIECFDVAFKEEDLGKGEHVTPATYRNRIARSLQRLTGQPFGGDELQWRRWWREAGSKNAELK